MHILDFLLLILAGLALIAILSMFLVNGIRYLLQEVRLSLAHRRARSIQPQKGQIWIQDGEEDNEILIQDINEDGTIVLTKLHPLYFGEKAQTWKDTPETWKERFSKHRLILGGL